MRITSAIWTLAVVCGQTAMAAEDGAPAVLVPLLRETPQPNYGAAVPARICGRVARRAQTNTEGVPGVSVTDGYSVVKTDAQGAYVLVPDPKAVFVYVTRPSAHDVQGAWYKPLAAQVDFLLTRASRDEGEYTFVHVTDTHISSSTASLEGLSRFVNEVNALDPVPRFVINSGDLVNLSKTLSDPPQTGHALFRNYVGIMNHLAMPYYNVAGDHTDSAHRLDLFPRGDIRCGKPLYWEYLGPHYFSFEYGKIHYVSVDFGYHLGKNQIHGREYPTLEVQPMHVEWMKQDMSQRTPGCVVVTASENDLAEHCPGFLELARQHDVRLQLTGDDHDVAYEPREVPYRSGGALSGCWWNPKCAQLCPDLSPAGYLIYHAQGERLECFYKGLGQRVAVVSHRVGAPWSGMVTLQAHLVHPRPNERLEYSLNGGPWSPMRAVGRPFYRTLYQATVDSTTLPDGLTDLRVRSSLTDEMRSQPLVVANGTAPGRFNTDATLTLTVGQVIHGPPKTPTGQVDVLFNGNRVGTLAADKAQAYSFAVPAASLRVANTLRFAFAASGDGMAITKLALQWEQGIAKDPRDAAVRQVRVAHWGNAAADWGGFVVGDGGLVEGPFRRRQQEFCFVLSAEEHR